MSVTVKLRMVRHSARKLAPVTRLVQGKALVEAINQTSVMSQHSAKEVNKLLKMAQAAATSKEFKAEDLVVAQIFATQGPKIRRQRPNARGRANRYLKHLAHLTVVVGEAKPVESKTPKKSTKTKAETKEAQPTEATAPVTRSKKGNS